MTQLKSWGRYPRLAQTAQYANWQADVPLLVAANTEGFLPFGNGRSYGDSCLADSGKLICTKTLNRFMAVDWQQGIVRAEAGVLLGDVLEQCVPRGWFLPVTPGTKFVTLAGAVANDVHGKNHHVMGTFGRHVRRFALQRSDQGIVECSLDENTALYNATISGLGLTGVILWVEFQLMPIKSSYVDVQDIKFSNLDEFFKLSDEVDADFDYTVAWVDCASRGSNLGRGIYSVANHACHGELQVSVTRQLKVPVELPFSLVNNLSLRGFNTVYYNKQREKRRRNTVLYAPFFYPLDAILEWNRIYGKAGFQQYQCAIPEAESQPALKAMLEAISQSGTGSFLAVLKRCGEIESPGLISFPIKGASLALDFPQVEGKLEDLFQRLDSIVEAAQGRLYPAKDAHMKGAFFRNAYPGWERLEAIRDPKILSRFWQRVSNP